MDTIKIPVSVEIRESEGQSRLFGTIIQEGRAAAGGRAELFSPGSVVWPDSGVAIRIAHHGDEQTRAIPVRHPNGEIRIAAKATQDIVNAINAGRTSMSVEFTALRENRTAAGIREIERAYVDGATLTDDPEYVQTKAEIRSKQKVVTWL